MEFRTSPTDFVEQIEGFKDRIPEFDSRSGEHLWVNYAVYRINPVSLLAGNQALMDHESLLSVQGPGCFYCGQRLTTLLIKQRCKGHE